MTIIPRPRSLACPYPPRRLHRLAIRIGLELVAWGRDSEAQSGVQRPSRPPYHEQVRRYEQSRDRLIRNA